MPSEDKRFGLGCLSLMFILIGLVGIVASLIALKHGTTVPFGIHYSTIQVSPWLTLIFGSVLLGFGIAGIWRIYKDKDKYPF